MNDKHVSDTDLESRPQEDDSLNLWYQITE